MTLQKVEQSWAYIFQLALAKFDKPAHLEISHQRHMVQIGHVLKGHRCVLKHGIVCNVARFTAQK